MKKLTLCLCALAIFILVACNPQATSSENTSASGSPVGTETPAPAQEPGKSFTYNFDLPVKGEGRTYGKKASVPSGQWNELRVTAAGNLFEVYLNNQKLYEVEDNTFPEDGKVGLWTKADSVTHFDDLRVTAK